MQADRMNLRLTIYHQGGEGIMTQGVLSFQYEEEKLGSGATSLSGLPVYLDFAHVAGLRESIRRHVRVREGSQGWTDEQLIVSLMLLNLAGGECVDDFTIRCRMRKGKLVRHLFLRRMSIYRV